MQIIEAGHWYKAQHFENPENSAEIKFINKRKDENNELVTNYDGTTNEELMIILIDRVKFLENLFPCTENRQTIIHLELALDSQLDRTKNRIKQGVEGKHLPHKSN